jgi:hypothetical protein
MKRIEKEKMKKEHKDMEVLKNKRLLDESKIEEIKKQKSLKLELMEKEKNDLYEEIKTDAANLNKCFDTICEHLKEENNATGI